MLDCEVMYPPISKVFNIQRRKIILIRLGVNVTKPILSVGMFYAGLNVPNRPVNLISCSALDICGQILKVTFTSLKLGNVFLGTTDNYKNIEDSKYVLFSITS